MEEETETLIKKLGYCELEYQQDGYLSVGKFKAIKQATQLIKKQNSIIKNAIDYIQYNNKELKNYSEQEMLDWLYGLDKCCEIKEEKNGQFRRIKKANKRITEQSC